MNKLKRVFSVILAVITVVCALASCSTLEEGDKGAVIDVYMTNEIFNFDPAYAFTDASGAKILSLIFEGLTRLDENGNWEKALMKSYEVSQDDDEAFKIQVTLNDTKWSDSRTVQANDLVFAWKRILDPEFKCEAASMLYDIKNARKVKMGDASIDDLGIFAIETYVLEIEFEQKIDLDGFFKTVASPALVPLREDIVSMNSNWAKKASSMVTNGPFDIKELVYGETMRLERSAYYYRDADKNEALDKYVIPYRLITHYDIGTLDDQLDALLSGEIFYLGEIPLSAREEYEGYSNRSDIAATHTYYFNLKNEVLSDVNVRKALSMAIDREEICNIVKYAKPATGFIPHKIYETDGKTEFRTAADKDGSLISTSAALDEAKKLIKSAGAEGASLSISVRDDEVDYAVAEYIRDEWKELGINAKIRVLGYSYDANDSTVVVDDFYAAYANGDFDVIAIDTQLLTNSAYSALAPFASTFSGNGVDMESETYDVYGHVTGYSDSAYDEIFEKYSQTADSAERTAFLHEAESTLLNEAVVMPIYFEQDAFLFSDVLDNIGAQYFGRNFNSMTMKDYMSYKEAAETGNADDYLNEVND